MNNEMTSKSDRYKAVVFTVVLVISALLLTPVTMHILNFVLGNIKV
jgi:hypothetical protein